MGIKIQTLKFENNMGYGIRITRDDITVQDYLDAINHAILNLDLSRLFTHEKDCFGCPLCCKDRIPLTMVDIQRLAKSPWIMDIIPEKAKKHREDKLYYILRRFSNVSVMGSLVDITMDTSREGICPFLDNVKMICNVYDHRPFVCQSFICCPLEEEAMEIRKAIVNEGEDELVKWLYNHAQKEGLSIWYNEANSYQINPDDFQETAFESKKDYSEIRLKDLLPRKLWNKIRT